MTINQRKMKVHKPSLSPKFKGTDTPIQWSWPVLYYHIKFIQWRSTFVIHPHLNRYEKYVSTIGDVTFTTFEGEGPNSYLLRLWTSLWYSYIPFVYLNNQVWDIKLLTNNYVVFCRIRLVVYYCQRNQMRGERFRMYY